jgi:hypothetical protein
MGITEKNIGFFPLIRGKRTIFKKHGNSDLWIIKCCGDSLHVVIVKNYNIKTATACQAIKANFTENLQP